MKTIRPLALLPVTIVIFALAWGAILMGSGRKTALAASPDGLHLEVFVGEDSWNVTSSLVLWKKRGNPGR